MDLYIKLKQVPFLFQGLFNRILFRLLSNLSKPMNFLPNPTSVISIQQYLEPQVLPFLIYFENTCVFHGLHHTVDGHQSMDGH